MTKKWLIICLVAALVVFGSFLLRSRQKVAKQAKVELLSFYEQVQPGLPLADVETRFKTNNFSRLKLKMLNGDGMLVETPIEWGAINWVLVIEAKERSVRAVRPRLHDDSTIRPKDAPPDKELE